jgi:hypothetical protein
MRRRGPRRAFVILVLAGCLGAGVAAAPLLLDGARFAWVVEKLLPATRGKIRIGRGSWTWGAAWAYARGRPALLEFEDVVVTDPDQTEVLRARRLVGTIEIQAAPRRVVFHDLRITGAVWRMARLKDGSGIGFLAAAEPVERSSAVGAAPSQKGRGRPGPTFQLEDVRIDGLDAIFDLPGWSLTLRDVHAVGHLGLREDPERHPLFTFDVSNGDVRGGGRISILDGIWRSVLPFSSARIARIATTQEAPDAIALDASGITTGRSSTALHGELTGVFSAGGRSKPSGIALSVAINDAADALQAAAIARGWAPKLGIRGAGAALALTFSGPMAALTLDASARGFDVGYGALAARRLGFHLEAQPAARRLALDGLTFSSPAGGDVRVDARLDHLQASAALVLRGFESAPYLPPSLRDAAGAVDGRAQARVDLGARTAAIDALALTIARPPGVVGPRVVHVLATGTSPPPRAPGDALLWLPTARLARGALELSKLTTSLAGGRVAASGRLNLWDPIKRDWVPSPSFDLTVDASGVAFERLTGSRLVTGPMSFRAQLAGTFDDVALNVRFPPRQRLRALGDSFTLPPALALRFAGRTFSLAPASLRGDSGASLEAQGTVDLAGGLGLDVTASRFPLRGLVALAAGASAAGDGLRAVEGEVTARLRLAGARAAPVVTGAVTVSGARFWGAPLGGGTLAITTGAGGEIRAVGQPIDGVKVSGVLRGAGASRPRVDAAVTLAHLRLDPFLPSFPRPAPRQKPSPVGGVTMTGVVSGSLTSHFALGDSPVVDARLAEVALMLTPPPRSPRSATAVELHVSREAHLVAAWGGGGVRLRLDPTRFSGTLGEFELSAATANGAVTGHARGELDLAAFAPFLPDSVEALQGGLHVDVGCGGNGDAAAVARSLRGDVSVGAPLRARFKDVPFDVRIPAGRVTFSDAGEAAIEGVTLTLGRGALNVSGRVVQNPGRSPALALTLTGDLDARLVEPFAEGYVRDAEGSAHVTARLTGPVDRLSLRAHAAFGGITFTMLPGANHVRVAGGSIDIVDQAAVVSALDLQLGGDSAVVIGSAADGLGHLRLQAHSLMPTAVDLPARGTVHALRTPVAVIDSASFALRLRGAPQRTLRLAGEIVIANAHVPPELRHPHASASNAAKSGSAAFGAIALDVTVRSPKRAVTIEVGRAPDLHAGLDYHVGGTVGSPEVSGHLEPAGLYSTLALFVARLFR